MSPQNTWFQCQFTLQRTPKKSLVKMFIEFNAITLKKNNMLYLINKIVATYYKQCY